VGSNSSTRSFAFISNLNCANRILAYVRPEFEAGAIVEVLQPLGIWRSNTSVCLLEAVRFAMGEEKEDIP
jgi:hypothetical protein